jgi:hypothetical protein
MRQTAFHMVGARDPIEYEMADDNLLKAPAGQMGGML